ncbi:MAG: ATP-binding cassette domain-containing protein [Acidobacteria bacterium]|nr:ATP-binding cassette domain-containing protein [Acidobacteriota bacterium]
MNILSLENVSKTFGIKPLFSSVSFGLDERDKIGVIGANGSGKSTLLKVISGEEQPDTGRVVIANGKVIATLSQNPPFDHDQTVIEAVFAGSNEALHQKLELLRQYETACEQLAEKGGNDEKLLKRVSDLAEQLEISGAWHLETELKAILNELGITQLSAKMSTLSGGQRKRVALAHSLFIKSDLLILDEPTNHLDAETVEWLERWLADFNGAMLLVTHDRYFLDRVTNRIIEIDRGRVQLFTGNYLRYLEKRQDQEEREVVKAQKLRQMARRELEWLRRGPKARTSKSKARIDRAIDLLRQSRQATNEIANKKSLDVAFEAFSMGSTSRLGKKILGLQNISKSFGDKTFIKDFSYQFKRRDRIGVIGPNGSGKTTLLEIIAGRLQPDAGEIDKGETVVIGYYDQENREFDESLRLIDYIRDVAENILAAEGDVITASQMLDRFLFPPVMQYQPIATLSGGERRRLYLLRMLMSAPNLLLLDEITNDLDIPTMVALEEYLETFPGCLIVVSHDRYFLDRTIDYVLRFEGASDGGFRIREYPGNYSGYLEIREREKVEEKAREQKQSVVVALNESSANRKLSFKEKRELEELEMLIAAAEARKAEAEAELAANGSDHVLVTKLYHELQSLNETLERNIERWADLADLAG